MCIRNKCQLLKPILEKLPRGENTMKKMIIYSFLILLVQIDVFAGGYSNQLQVITVPCGEESYQVSLPEFIADNLLYDEDNLLSKAEDLYDQPDKESQKLAAAYELTALALEHTLTRNKFQDRFGLKKVKEFQNDPIFYISAQNEFFNWLLEQQSAINDLKH